MALSNGGNAVFSAGDIQKLLAANHHHFEFESYSAIHRRSGVAARPANYLHPLLLFIFEVHLSGCGYLYA